MLHRRLLQVLCLGCLLILGMLIILGISPLQSFAGSPLGGTSQRTAAPASAAAGIHMGNRNGFWNPALLLYSDGCNTAFGGRWPSMLVFLTRQAYNVSRTAAPDCRITKAMVSVRPELKEYLQAASVAGVKIVLRIFPSPGNFNADHSLSSLSTPADGGSMCGTVNGKAREETYRGYLDLVDEIKAIHDWNVDNGITEYAFVPANEPDLEWYQGTYCPSGAPFFGYNCINNTAV